MNNSSSPISSLTKIYLASGLVLLILIGTSYFAYSRMVQSEISGNWVHHTFDVIEKSQLIEINLNEATNAQRGFILVGKERYEKDFTESFTALNQNIDDLQVLAKDNPRQFAAAHMLETKIQELGAHFQNTISLTQLDQRDKALEKIQSGFDQVRIDAIRALLKDFKDRENALLKSRLGTNEDFYDLARKIFILSILLGLITIVIAVYFLHREFTEKFEIQTKFAQNAQIQKIMLQSAGFSFIAVNLEGKITLFNEAAEKLLGYKAEEVIGKSPEIIHLRKEIESMARKLSTRFNEVIEPGIAVFTYRPGLDLAESDQWTYVKKDGERVQVKLTVTSIKDHSGKISGFIGIAYDMTLQIKTEESLIKAREEALSSTRAKSEFLANMSHEIRTPMNAIMGMAELLLETQMDEEQKKYVQIFQRAGDSLLNLINDILDLSKIETNHFELERSAFKLSSVVEKSAEIIAIKAHQKHIELAIDMDQDIPDHFYGDPNRLRQILINIMGNAVKFTKKGEVLLSVKNLGIQNQRQGLQIEVSDTGIGMGPEQLKNLFERFSQGDSSITKEFGGTGLGLNITKKLITLLGGTVDIESTQGIGTKVRIKIYLEIDPAATPPKSFNLEGIRVLVVDDTRTNRMIFKKIIESQNGVVKEAENAYAAIKMMENEIKAGTPFNFILLDCRMPEMDGFALADKIQNDEKLRGPMLFMLTSDSRPGDLNKSREMGIESYLVKPIMRQDLLHAITQAFFHKKTEPEVEAVAREEKEKQRLSILLVDDNKENRFVIRSFLKNEPWEIVEAKNGREAVTLYMEKTFDLVLMDMQMPIMDGYTATREIRKLEKNRNLPEIPVVALTAYALDEEIKRSFESGCNDHLSKPVSKKSLLECIENFSFVAKSEVQEELKHLYPGYLARRKEELQMFRRSMQEGDFENLEIMSHKVKGSAGSYGLDQIEPIAYQMEKAAQSEDPEKFKLCFEEYERVLAKLPV
jgi:PAS domain S-box-containing protein